MYFPATQARFVQKDSLSLSWGRNLLYIIMCVFRKDRQCKFILLLSVSLDLLVIC